MSGSSALKLRVLWLSNNRIGCKGVAALAKEREVERLERIQLAQGR